MRKLALIRRTCQSMAAKEQSIHVGGVIFLFVIRIMGNEEKGYQQSTNTRLITPYGS